MRGGPCDGCRAEAESGHEDQAAAQAAEEIVDYVVEIENWDWGYSFSLNLERLPIDPYHEFRHLQIKGRLLTPAGQRTDRAEISLLRRPTGGEASQGPDAGRARLAHCWSGRHLGKHRNPLGRPDADPANADRRTIQVRPDARDHISTP
jgi:hypothetical protein